MSPGLMILQSFYLVACAVLTFHPGLVPLQSFFSHSFSRIKEGHGQKIASLNLNLHFFFL